MNLTAPQFAKIEKLKSETTFINGIETANFKKVEYGFFSNGSAGLTLILFNDEIYQTTIDKSGLYVSEGRKIN